MDSVVSSKEKETGVSKLLTIVFNITDTVTLKRPLWHWASTLDVGPPLISCTEPPTVVFCAATATLQSAPLPIAGVGVFGLCCLDQHASYIMPFWYPEIRPRSSLQIGPPRLGRKWQTLLWPRPIIQNKTVTSCTSSILTTFALPFNNRLNHVALSLVWLTCLPTGWAGSHWNTQRRDYSPLGTKPVL